jgi:hypothetical protein
MIAYIDPGSGSYFFQLLIGGLLGAAVAVKMLWRRVWAFLTGRRPRKRDPDRADADSARDTDPAAVSRTSPGPG